MHREEAQKATRAEAQQTHDLVLVAALGLVQRALSSGVRKVGGRAAVDVAADDGGVAKRERAGLERGVRAVDGEDDTGHDRVVCLLHEPESRELREQILEVAADLEVFLK